MVTRHQRRIEPHTSLVLQEAPSDVEAPRLVPVEPLAESPTEGVPDEPIECITMPRWKRVMDVLLAGAALLVLAPVFAVLAVLVKVDSPGPAIFRQRRVGRGGIEFTCLKFRSMYVDAEERLAALAHLNEARGHVFKMRDDPRRTRIGKVLRKTSLDELPQFWNVLRGDMTLVGPRPPLVTEVERYESRERQRLRGTPGITGLWQVSARERHDFEEMLELDLAYLESISFARDCRLLLATIPAVLGARGSH